MALYVWIIAGVSAPLHKFPGPVAGGIWCSWMDWQKGGGFTARLYSHGCSLDDDGLDCDPGKRGWVCYAGVQSGSFGHGGLKKGADGVAPTARDLFLRLCGDKEAATLGPHGGECGNQLGARASASMSEA